MNLCIAVVCNNHQKISWIDSAVDFLQEAFRYTGVSFEFVSSLDHNVFGVHPSWYKLLLHKHFGYRFDYCLCWDLDLLPTNRHSVRDIISEISMDKFYACRDSGTLQYGNDQYFTTIDGIVSNFRWNCGLFGIPKAEAFAMERIYQTHHNSTKPSYEQYHVAEYLYSNQDKIIEGDGRNNVLVQAIANSKLNQILHFATANCLHYSISDPSVRYSMIHEHCSWKERIFG